MSDVRTTSQLADTLHAIGRWYPGTADPPRTAASTIRSAPGSKPPIPADVLSLRRETVDTLTSWALLVAEERDLRPDIKCARPRDVPPSIQGPACATCDHDSCQQARPYLACGCSRDPGRRLPDSGAHRLNAEDVPALISFLSTHTAWLAGHVAGLDALAELSRVARNLEEVARQTRPARVKIGPCPEADCNGQLKATVRTGEDLLPSTIVCGADPEHAWTTWQWHTLGRRVAPLHPAAVRRMLRAMAGDSTAPREYGAGRSEWPDRWDDPQVLAGLIGEPEGETRRETA